MSAPWDPQQPQPDAQPTFQAPPQQQPAYPQQRAYPQQSAYPQQQPAYAPQPTNAYPPQQPFVSPPPGYAYPPQPPAYTSPPAQAPPPGPGQEWGMTLPVKAFYWFIAGLMALAALGFVMVAVRHETTAPAGGPWFGAVLFAAVAAAFWWVTMRLRLIADDSGITIRNVFAVHHVAWGEIRKITPGYWGLKIERSTGPSINVTVVQKSNYAQGLGKHTRSDAIALYLAQRAAWGRYDPALLLPTVTDQAKSRRTAQIVIALVAAYFVLRIVAAALSVH